MDKHTAADWGDKMVGTPDTVGTGERSHLIRVTLQLLAAGDPITPAELAASAGVLP